MIQIKNLQKSYRQADGTLTPVLKGISLNVEKGEVISLIGPSGTGKSTLLRCINGLEKAEEGEILLDGMRIVDSNLSRVRQRIGMVFQNFNLFAHLTVLENLTLAPMKLLGLSRPEAEKQALELLAQVGMAEKARVMPDSLSGGQKQRVAIARTLCMHPDCILFDEPTSALDPTMVGEVLSVIRRLAAQGLTMIIVTHEMKFARDVSTRVLFLSGGHVLEEGTPEQIFEHPQQEATREFLQHIRKLHYEFDTPDADTFCVNGDVASLCLKYGFSFNRFTLDLVLEELLQVLVKDCRPLTLDLLFGDEVTVRIRIPGRKESLLKPAKAAKPEEEQLSPLLLKQLCRKIQETVTEEGLLMELEVQ